MPAKLLTVAASEIGRAGWIVDAATKRGLKVAGLDTPGDRYYWGGPVWAAANASELGVALIEPVDEWLTEIPTEWLARRVTLTTLGDAKSAGRAFIKPPSSKDFPARIYDGRADLSAATEGLPDETPALVSDPVEFAAEYRLFILDGKVHTGSRYATWGQLDPGTLLSADANRVCTEVEAMLDTMAASLPSAVVVDAGLVGPPDDPRRDVAIVEANMAWFAQPYWAETDKVLEVVMRSAGPRADLRERDRSFVREN